MDLTREQLAKLREMGIDSPYELVPGSGDPATPSGTDLMRPRMVQSSPNLLDMMRSQADVRAQVPGDAPSPMLPFSPLKPDLSQPDLMAKLRGDAGVELKPFNSKPEQPQSPIADSLKKIADKSDSKRAATREPSSEESKPMSPEEAPRDSSKALLAAFRASNDNAGMAGILDSALDIGASLGRTTANKSGLDEMRKQGQKPTDFFNATQTAAKEDQALEKGSQEQKLLHSEMDPQSPVSRTVRDMMAQMGLPVSEQTSAKQLRDQGVDISKLLVAKEAAETRRLQAKMMGDYKQTAADQKQTLQDQRIHDQVLRRIDNNPNVKNRLTQIQNLDNALSVIANTEGGVTPQQIMEAQQLVARNMGIQGGSGVGERAERYIHTMGMKGGGLLQFLTGDPVMLSKDSKLMNYIKNQANTERGNAKQQLMNTISAVSAGHQSIYDRNPELLSDLMSKMTVYHDTLSSPEMTTSSPGNQPANNSGGPKEGMVVNQKDSNGNTHTYTFRNGKWE